MSKYQKVEFEYPVHAIHGKPCSHTNTYFAVNGFTKQPYISKLCYPSTTVTTTAQTIQRGDTTTVIMTKTIESYDGKVDASKLLQAAPAVSGL